MLRIFFDDGTPACSGRHPVLIVADTEAEITGMGEVIRDGLYTETEVTPEDGSVAVTVAGGKLVPYMKLPSGWAKTGG